MLYSKTKVHGLVRVRITFQNVIDNYRHFCGEEETLDESKPLEIL